MSRSLQRRLSFTLAAAILGTGLLAAIASFAFAYFEAQEMQDDTLQEVAILFAQRASGSGWTAKAGERDVLTSSRDESRVVVMHLARGARPPWLPEGMVEGFRTVDVERERSRVYVLPLADGERMLVMQPTEIRDEIAFNSAWRTLVPLLFLLPLLAWLTARIIAAELTPVRKLASAVDQLEAERPAPLPATGVPVEVASFVHAINRLLERVARLLHDKRRFIADAAHELRTPLTALSLQAQNVEYAESLEAARERLAALRTGIDRARRLTEQLLTLARTQAAASEQFELDLAKLLREIVAEYLPLATARGIDLGMDVDGALTLTGSPDALRLIVSNALDNALRYTPSGGEVTVRLRTEASDVLIEIIDNGPGIRAADRARAFEPFHRLGEASPEGSGLGLAIARDAASRLGGSVSLHDRPDGPGLIFRYRQRRTS
jgi:two-component system OmpR family sensor kinase